MDHRFGRVELICCRFCYVDLEDADDLDKALALAGQKLKGQEVKIEQAKQRNEPKTAEKKTPQKDDAQTPNKRAGELLRSFISYVPLTSWHWNVMVSFMKDRIIVECYFFVSSIVCSL